MNASRFPVTQGKLGRQPTSASPGLVARQAGNPGLSPDSTLLLHRVPFWSLPVQTLLVLLGIVTFLSGRPLVAAEPVGPSLPSDSPPEIHGALSIRLENDAFAGTDEDYSNGISLSLLLQGRGLLGGMWDWFGSAERQYFHAYEVGQVIVTPSDTRLAIPAPGDRPYAGMLYIDLATAMRQGNLFHGFKIVTGVVGPYSLAEETQNWFHDLIGSGHAQGWDYQLHNEPILNLMYEHRRKYQLFHTQSGFGADIIPAASAMLGNVLIQAQAGAQLRLGYNLPDDFGTTLLRGFGTMPFPRFSADVPAPKFGLYAFASAGGTAVAHNISLDGNSFQHSPHVDKRPFFATAEVGTTLWTRWFEANFTYVYWGKEFSGQQKDSQFGAVSLSWFF